jgi:hypothetical protein
MLARCRRVGMLQVYRCTKITGTLPNRFLELDVSQYRAEKTRWEGLISGSCADRI